MRQDDVSRWISFLGDEGSDCEISLGTRGAKLARMALAGLPIPSGFVITTQACESYYVNNASLPEALWEAVKDAVGRLEAKSGKSFGVSPNGLLLRVAASTVIPVPGILGDLYNVGIPDDELQGATDRPGSSELTQIFLKSLEKPFLQTSQTHLTMQTTAPPEDQLRTAITAMFRSWRSPHSELYRQLHGVQFKASGMAIVVQALRYEASEPSSGTGVFYTRDPECGEKRLFGTYIPRGGISDLISGIIEPTEISGLGALMPATYGELDSLADRLERVALKVQRVEFVVEKKKLWLLDVNDASVTPSANLRITTDMVRERLIDPASALKRISPDDLIAAMHSQTHAGQNQVAQAAGLGCSAGVASGQIVFSAKEAERRAGRGEDIILVREETLPDDYGGILSARGVVTLRGGFTTHAAIVTRGLNKPCVTGPVGVELDHTGGELKVNGHALREGDWLTINGATGEIFVGRLAVLPPRHDTRVKELVEWTKPFRRMRVRANADTATAARLARELGSEGIGLCRIEHMLFGEERLQHVRSLILAESRTRREEALEQLSPLLREDFIGIMREMPGLPVTIRMLDAPLHEFLPNYRQLLSEIMSPESFTEVPGDNVEQGSTISDRDKHLIDKALQLNEANPMLGHRGCRFGVTHPEVTRAFAKVVFEAASLVLSESSEVIVEIMIPFISTAEELISQAELVRGAASEVMKESGVVINYRVGAMIELPRAAIIADTIALHADFISFGTNDLTQTTYGLSRDDSGRFISQYLTQGILPSDPFVKLDFEGVGQLIRWGGERARQAKPEIKIGVCGEHGGDPQAIQFFHDMEIDYVSCSPHRVPAACLAAARATLSASPQSNH